MFTERQKERYERHFSLSGFGMEGQTALRNGSALCVGAGGLGSHVIQQLALYGVGTIVVADHEELSTSNRNRYVGAWHDDPIPGSPKVSIASTSHLRPSFSSVFMRVKMSSIVPSSPGITVIQQSL